MQWMGLCSLRYYSSVTWQILKISQDNMTRDEVPIAQSEAYACLPSISEGYACLLNTLRTGDADLRVYITTVQDGW
jgi:hypothetical protein